MEIGIPLLAMGGLYIISNQSKKKDNFQNRSKLPNVDVPDKNYPSQYPVVSAETDLTSKLSTVNKIDGTGVYTDKYFNPQYNQTNTDAYSPFGDSVAKNPNASYYSLTGDKVDQDYFRHNNMVPFFGGNIRSRNVDANANESVLDNYIGSGSQTIVKKEQAPLFAPGENYQWANGAPNTTDFMRSRVNPSSRMANVKPFEEQRVAPGLGLGFTSEGSGGFNSGMMNRNAWNEKTVDELRVATNPKSSGHLLLGHEGPAMNYITRRGELGVMEKNRPDGSFEVGQDRYLTTTGLEKAPTLRSVPIERFVNRPETTAEYAGIAGYGKSNLYVDGEHMPTHRIELGSVPFTPAGASGKYGATESDYGMKSKVAYPNNRSSNTQNSYYGAIGGAFGAAVAPLLDALRPSRKENTIGTLRPYQNAKSNVSSSYVYDPNDKPLPTIRETTESSKFHLNVNANQRGGAYQVAEQQPIHNARETTGNYFYAGNSSAGARSQDMRSYEAEYNQRNNDIKSSTIDGRLVPGNMNLYDGNINMAAKPKDNYLVNSRPLAPQGTTEAPSIYNMGRMSGAEPLYQTIQLDRNSPDVLNALQGNPYAIPYRAK